MDNNKLEEVKQIADDIEEFVTTGTCKFHNGTCCRCPGDEHPEDMTACYKYALEQVLAKLNSIVRS